LHSKVALAPDLPASAKNAVLYLQLVASADALATNWIQTIAGISGSLSQRMPVIPSDHSNGCYAEERLIAIQADGFVIRFTDRVGGEIRTNFVLFPFGQITETNTLGWNIIGDYSGKAAAWPGISAEPDADSRFHLLSTNGLAPPPTGGGPAF
jgi:hypothetical protein